MKETAIFTHSTKGEKTLHSMSDDEKEDEEEERNPCLDLWPDFEPLIDMPSSRLNDVLNNLETKQLSVLSLDGCLPGGDMCSVVLQTILFKMTSSVKTLSLRFNNLTPAACSVLNDWIGINKSLEMLYLMSSGIDDKSKASLETSWRKNLTSQRTENWGYTFIRVPAPEQEEEDEA